MSIANSTGERVGVEVSGPTGARLHKIALFMAGAGTGAALCGLIYHDPTLTVAGLLIATVSGVLLWRISCEAKKLAKAVSLPVGALESSSFRTVLEPCQELDDPDIFNNLIVSFYRVDEENVFVQEIAAIDFNDVDYIVKYHPDLAPEEWDGPHMMTSEPIRIDLQRPDLTQYHVDVAQA